MKAELEKAADGVAEFLARVSRATGTELETIKRVREGDVPFVVIDQGREIKNAADLVKAYETTQPAPYRRRGLFAAASVKALLDWMARHCSEEAPVFGEGAERLADSWKAPKLALLGIGNYSDRATAGWHDFGVRYDFPVTLAWKEWVALSGEALSQADFAEFVEKHLYEISSPMRNETLSEAVNRMIEALGGSKSVATPEKMYELSRGVKITVSEKVEVRLDRASGESVMHFTEEHTGAGGRPVALPKFFYIRLPIFFGEEPSLIGVLLRYRNAGAGSVVWTYELFAPDLAVKAAFDKACDAVTRAQRPFYLGTADKP